MRLEQLNDLLIKQNIDKKDFYLEMSRNGFSTKDVNRYVRASEIGTVDMLIADVADNGKIDSEHLQLNDSSSMFYRGIGEENLGVNESYSFGFSEALEEVNLQENSFNKDWIDDLLATRSADQVRFHDNGSVSIELNDGGKLTLITSKSSNMAGDQVKGVWGYVNEPDGSRMALSGRASLMAYDFVHEALDKFKSRTEPEITNRFDSSTAKTALNISNFDFDWFQNLVDKNNASLETYDDNQKSIDLEDGSKLVFRTSNTNKSGEVFNGFWGNIVKTDGSKTLIKGIASDSIADKLNSILDEYVEPDLPPENNFNFSSSVNKEATTYLLFQTLLEAGLGATASPDETITSDSTIADLLAEIASINGDSLTSKGPEFDYDGVTGQIMQALLDKNYDVYDKTRAITRNELMDVLHSIKQDGNGIELSEAHQDLLAGDIEMFGEVITYLKTQLEDTEMTKSLPEILGEIAQIFGDQGVPGSLQPNEEFTGYTASIAKAFADFDIYDETKPIAREVLKSMIANMADTINLYTNFDSTEAFSSEGHRFSFQNKDQISQVNRILNNRLQQVLLGGSDIGNINLDQTLAGLLEEIAKVTGDSGIAGSLDPDEQFSGVAGQIKDFLAENNYDVFDKTKVLTAPALIDLMDEISSLTGGEVFFGDTYEQVELSTILTLKKVNKLVEEKIQAIKDSNGDEITIPSVLGGIADLLGDFGIPGSLDPNEQFMGLTGSIAKGIADFDIYDTSSTAEIEALETIIFNISDVIQASKDFKSLTEISHSRGDLEYPSLDTLAKVNGLLLKSMTDHFVNPDEITIPSLLDNIAGVLGDVKDSDGEYTNTTGAMQMLLEQMGYDTSDKEAPMDTKAMRILFNANSRITNTKDDNKIYLTNLERSRFKADISVMKFKIDQLKSQIDNGTIDKNDGNVQISQLGAAINFLNRMMV